MDGAMTQRYSQDSAFISWPSGDYISWEERYAKATKAAHESKKKKISQGLHYLNPHPVITVIIKLPTANDLSTLNEDTLTSTDSATQWTTSTFVIHKSFICQYSPFFKAAFNGSFQEGITQSITFTDIDPVHFGIFNHWIYTQEIELSKIKDPHEPDMLFLGQLWVLGDRFLAATFQNALMDLMFDKSTKFGRNISYFEFLYGEDGGHEVLQKIAMWKLGQLKFEAQSSILVDAYVGVETWKDLAQELNLKLAEKDGSAKTRTAEDFYVEGLARELDLKLAEKNESAQFETDDDLYVEES